MANYTNSGGGGWLLGVPPEAKALIHEVMAGVSGPPSKRHHSRGTGWWIRRAPTTGEARDVTLLHKPSRSSWVILENHELVADAERERASSGR